MKKERLSRVCALALAGLLGLSSLGQATESPEVVATVEGQPITAAEIEARIKAEMMRINNQIYTTKKQAVDDNVDDAGQPLFDVHSGQGSEQGKTLRLESLEYVRQVEQYKSVY